MTRAGALAAALLLLCAPAVHAADAPRAPDHFTIVIGFPPGQGNDQAPMPDASSTVAGRIAAEMTFDQTARFLARHLPRLLPHAPGSRPRAEVRASLGAAGFVAAGILALAKPDGTTVGLLSSNAIMASALGRAGGRLNARAFTWIGGVAPDVWTCLRRTDAPTDRPLWTGSLGAGSRGDIHARALAEHAGMNLRPLSGYTGRFELARSLENAEIDASCGWPLRDIQTRHGDWLRDGRMEIFAQFSGPARTLGAVPHAGELASSEVGRAVLNALEAESLIAWPFVAPPGMDPDSTAMWRKAFADLITDTFAVAEAARMGVALEPVSGRAVQDAVEALHALAPEAKAGLAGVVGRR